MKNPLFFCHFTQNIYMNEDIAKALDVLHNGGIILYPTDTIWGIGCDATNLKAVKRIYELKQREDSKSMLVLLDNEAKLNSYITQVPEMAWDLIEFSTKPLTIIYPNAKNLAPNLLAVDKSIGIRVTKEEFSNKLCQRFKKPIVSTSANISGQESPSCFDDISEEVKNGVDYIVNYRQEESSNPAPSSIMKLGVGGEIKIIRE